METSKTIEGNSKCLVLSEDCAKTLLAADDLPPKARELLGRNVDFAAHDIKDVGTMMEEMRDFIKFHSKCVHDNVNREKSCIILKACVSLIKLLMEERSFVEKDMFIVSITVLSYALTRVNLDMVFQTQTAQLCERFLDITGRYDKNCIDISLCTLTYLLRVTLGKFPDKVATKADFKRISDMKSLIGVSMRNSDVIKTLLLECVTSPSYLAIREGRLHIAAILSNDITHVPIIHNLIKRELPVLKKKVASFYGEVYFNAWSMAKSEVQKLIEEKCIQDLMELTFNAERYGLEMAQPESNILAILTSLHSSRRLHKFSNVITELYAPLIWRYLKSYDPRERCNAAQIFFSVFPMEKPSKGIVVNSEFRQKQVMQVYDLLVDDCHFVRILSIKGVSHHLSLSHDCFTTTDVQKLIEILSQTLAFDKSSYAVRRTVYESFEYMITQPKTAELILQCLPNLILNIHDVHEKVRVAFVKLLLTIQKNSNTLGMKYWDIVPLKHLIARLMIDDESVGKLIAKLLMPEIYVTGQYVDTSIRRFVKLLEFNPFALKKLFSYANNLLTTDDAHAVIVTIIGKISKELKLKTREESNGQKQENTSVQSDSTSIHSKGRPKRRKGDDSSSDSTKCSAEATDNRRTVDKEGSKDWIEDPITVAGLVSGAAILFAKFSVELSQNTNYAKNIQDMSVIFIPQTLLHFKGTFAYYAVINYASLIPINLLNPVSTVSGACLSELKEMTEETDPDVSRCLIYSLCAWKRGHEIIELAMEWLSYAFKSQNLSESVLPLRTKRRTRKVRFTPEVGKPLLAIKLLDYLLGDIWNERAVLRYSYNNAYELYLFLDRIKILLENRLNNDNPLDEPLSDDLLLGCYRWYLLMPITLHRPEQPPDASTSLCCVNGESQHVQIVAAEVFVKHLPWATNHLVDNLPPKDNSEEDVTNPPFVVKCIIEVLKTGFYIIGLNMLNRLLAQALALFAINLLETDWNPYFLEISIKIANALAAHGEMYTEKDEWNLFARILPSFIGRILEAIIFINLTNENIKTYITDFQEMKSSLFNCLKMIKRFYGKSDANFKQVYNLYVYACIEMVANLIKVEDNFVYSKKLDVFPKMATEILKHLISNEAVYQNLLASLNEHITQNKEEGVHLLSCLSILYTLAHYARSRFEKIDIENCIHNGFSCLNHLEEEKINVSRKNDTTFMSDSDTIDIHREGVALINELCKHVGCSPHSFQ